MYLFKNHKKHLIPIPFDSKYLLNKLNTFNFQFPIIGNGAMYLLSNTKQLFESIYLVC